MNEERVFFLSDGLELEGLLGRPRQTGTMRAAVVCHPHPQYGGSMYNNVVEAIVEAMWQLNFATLRFNFRGVGASDGAYDEGKGEANDAAAAVRHMTGLQGIERDRAILAGYSFGASVAVKAAEMLPQVFTIVAVAPPLLVTGTAQFERTNKRIVVIIGQHDMYCPPAQVDALRSQFFGAGRFKTIAKADHFLAGREAEITTALVEALKGA
jgi:uncharacterized protein